MNFIMCWHITKVPENKIYTAISVYYTTYSDIGDLL